MNRIFILAAFLPIGLMGCASSPFDLLEDNDADYEEVNYDYEDTYNYGDSVQNARSGTLTGDLPSLGELSRAPAEVDVRMSDRAIYFDLYHYADTSTSWGMIGGSVSLDGPLEVGDVIQIDTWNVIGCSGPRSGEYSFDEEPTDGTIVVVEGENGQELLFDFDFYTVGNVIGVAVLEDEE